MGTSNNVWTWSSTPGSNTTSDAGINWAEGQLPATVNDSARGMMAGVRNFVNDLAGLASTGGTANAQTLTTSSGFVTLTSGNRVTFKVGAALTNTGATTLNVDGLGSKAVKYFTSAGEVACAGGELQALMRYEVIYDSALGGGSGAWILLNPTPAASGGSFASATTTITGTGYVSGGGSLAANRTLALGNMGAVSRLLGSGSAASTIADITLGTNLSMSGTTLNAAGSTGTVTSVATSNGITGGTITGSGTVSLDTNNAGGIGCIAILANQTAGSVANGATATSNGTNLTFGKFNGSNVLTSAGATVSNGQVWRNICGGTLSINDWGFFIRVS